MSTKTGKINVPEMLTPIDPEKTEDLSDQFSALLAEKDLPELPSDFARFLGNVFGLSPFLQDCAFKEAAFLQEALSIGFEASIVETIENCEKTGCSITDEAEFMREIRIAKRRVALLVGLADLSRLWNCEKVTGYLSQFASASLSACLDFLLTRYHADEKLVLPDPDNPQHECGLIVLGMGKLGAGELNYSSDVDLILLYDDAAKIELLTDDPITVWGRFAKQLIRLMQERTGDGYVFRMDLRLRPDPSSTPLVVPYEAAQLYYEGQGQNWERAAMIKARPVAGDMKAGQSFLAEIKPFIWRKYLDFAAIHDVQSIKRQIHAHKGHGQIAVEGHNIKLGRGGIREIEFFVQTQQLITGGRNSELRDNRTIVALEKLQDHGWVQPQTVEDLKEAYWFLRDCEHRIQMVGDQQTHNLPENSEELSVIAAMFGESDLDVFSERVRATLIKVERHYAELFEAAPELGSGSGNLVFTGDDIDPGTKDTITQMGFMRAEDVINIVRRWHTARYPALRATQAKELLTELVPELLQSFTKSANPDEVMFNFDRFISGLPAGIQLFSILKNSPAIRKLLSEILVAAPRLAEQIARKPHVFDAMIDPQFAGQHPTSQSLVSALRINLENVAGYEMKLDEARRFLGQMRFMIGCQYFSSQINANQAAGAYSDLADAIITVMLDVVQEEFAIRHGKVPGSRVCILGMGRLGSRELTATSDLDLIFLYDYDEEIEESDGEKPLHPQLYFMRLIQRFITAMTSPTAEGILYELDFRLRPSGNAGPLATHVEGFLKYQRNEAWIWEAQALSRARSVAGNGDLCEQISKEIPDILSALEKDEKLSDEIFSMRMRIEEEKGDDNPWNVKVAKGGVLDVEFIAQWLTLNYGGEGGKSPGEVLGSAAGNNLGEDEREHLIKAYDLYSLVMHLSRVCLSDETEIAEAPAGFHEILTSSMDLPDLAACEAHLAAVQEQTRQIFTNLLKA